MISRRSYVGVADARLVGVLLAVEFGSVDQVDQRGLGLLPLARLETAVGVDPELVRLEVSKHLLDAVLDLVLGGNTRGVDVVDTGADVARVGLVDEDLEELGVALAVLNRQDIGIKSSDGVEEVLELRVAEVGVDLSRVANTSGRELERVDGPREVSLTLLAGAERKTLTKSRLVDLDDVDASRLEVDNLVTEGKSKLLSLDGLVDVVTGERPPQAGDGASEHTLHGLGGLLGSVLGLLDRHGSRARDVTDDDRGTDAAGAVRLDPGVGGEDIAVQPLAEVLDHVVTLRLAVDVDVKVELVLDGNDLIDLLLNELLVLLGGDLALGELVALNTDLLGLGERANGGGGEERKLEVSLLLRITLRELGLAVVLLRSDLGLTVLDSGVVGAGRRGASLHRLGVGIDLLTDRGRALGDGLGNDGDLNSLLAGEREPVVNLLRQLLLAGKSMGSVEEGAGGGNDDTLLAKLLDSSLNKLDGLLEVGLPDVTAVNNTGGEDLLGAELLDDGEKLLGVADKIDVKAVQVGDGGDDVEVVDDVTEVGGQDKLGDVVTRELLVGRLESILDLRGEVEDEDGLVNLDSLGASLLQGLEQLDVDGEQLLEEADGLDALITVGLAESKERDRAEDDGAGGDTSLLGLEELANGLGVGSQLEGLVVLEGRLNIVVVGVKPLDHFLQIPSDSALYKCDTCSLTREGTSMPSFWWPRPMAKYSSMGSRPCLE